MRIPVTILIELKIGDIFDAQIAQASHGLVAELNLKWIEGVPYRVYKQSFKEVE